MKDVQNDSHLQEIHTKSIFLPSFRSASPVMVHHIQRFSPLTQGKYLDRIVDENLYSQHWSMCFPLFHRFYEGFGEKTQELVTAGIVDYHLDNWIHPDDKKKYKHLNLEGPQVLTLEQLEAGFVIWIASVVATIVSFFFEWLVKLCEFILIRLVLKKCFELKIGLDQRILDQKCKLEQKESRMSSSKTRKLVKSNRDCHTIKSNQTCVSDYDKILVFSVETEEFSSKFLETSNL